MKASVAFQRAMDLVNGYLKKFDKNASPLGNLQISEKLSLATTKLTVHGINMEIGVALPEGKAADFLLSAPMCLLRPKQISLDL